MHAHRRSLPPKKNNRAPLLLTAAGAGGPPPPRARQHPAHKRRRSQARRQDPPLQTSGLSKAPPFVTPARRCPASCACHPRPPAECTVKRGAPPVPLLNTTFSVQPGTGHTARAPACGPREGCPPPPQTTHTQWLLRRTRMPRPRLHPPWRARHSTAQDVARTRQGVPLGRASAFGTFPQKRPTSAAPSPARGPFAACARRPYFPLHMLVLLAWAHGHAADICLRTRLGRAGGWHTH